MTKVSVQIVDEQTGRSSSGKLAAGVLTLHLALGSAQTIGLDLNVTPCAEAASWSGQRGNYQSLEEISSLDTDEFALLKPMRIKIKQLQKNDFLAAFEDGRVFASGETHIEAVEMLKDMLVGRLEHLSSIDYSKLGPEPLRQLSVLRSYIQEQV